MAANGEREGATQHLDRSFTMACAVVDAAHLANHDTHQIVAALVAIGWHESRFRRDVHMGNCRPGECDDGMASGPWQTWPLWGKTRPGVTYEPTHECARVAIRAYLYGHRQCGTTEGAMSHYQTGNLCHWKSATRRARLARRVERWLR